MEEDVGLEGSKHFNIESSEPTNLRSTTSETSDSTESAATPTPVAFPCRRAMPAGMQSTTAATCR